MKTAAIVSGGMDSVTLAYHYKAQGDELLLVSFDYGQRHAKELDYAHITAADLGAAHALIDLRDLTPWIATSSLTTADVDVPDGHYAEETMRATVVPNRNAIMLSIATGIAVAHGCDRVATGVHGGDHFIYPDCRPEFIHSMRETLILATVGHAVSGFDLDAPFVNQDKAWIAQYGTQLGVPWDQTWSCYKGGDVHCGSCGTCFERREAFSLAGVVDPTPYLATPQYADPR